MIIRTWTLAALGIACTGALAQQPAPHDETLGRKADRVFDKAEDATGRAVDSTRRTVDPPPGQPSLGQRSGRVFDRMEDATGRAVDKVRGSGTDAPRDTGR